MASLPRTIFAVASAAVGAAIAYPPSRKQIVRTARATLDELMVRAETPWTRDLVVLTSEGHLTHVPRTCVLTAVRHDGELHVMAWDPRAEWLRNVRVNPAVVVDDRVRVRRAVAEEVDAATAEVVRRAFIESNVPGPLRDLLGRDGAPLGPGHPVVRLTRR